MKELGLLQSMRLCRQYSRMDSAEREKVRNRRLFGMVTWAREKSPFYRELYKDIKTEFSLTDLPSVTKRQLMSQFDHWLTDSTIKLQDLEEFMENPDNIGRRFRGKYLIFTTSGSAGYPLTAICDRTSNNIMGAINALRSFARREDMKAFILRGGKTIGVFATEGFYLGNSSVRARQLAMPWKKNKIAVISALLPIHKITEQLNRFQPAMLGGYPSNLELLIDEQKSGRLHINPVLVMTGGEYLADSVRNGLADAFGCYVQTSYSCTEGGSIACECAERHFHMNDDWVLVEPVDHNNQPVPDGVQADKILLTNLYNHSQPFIRYEINDRVIMYHDPCPCGNPAPWLTLEGRTDDVVQFDTERVKRGGLFLDISPDLKLQTGDIMLLVGQRDALVQVAADIGPEIKSSSDMDLVMKTQEVVITSREFDKVHCCPGCSLAGSKENVRNLAEPSRRQHPS